LAILAWLAVPPIARSQIESRLTEALGRATTLEAVAFDPFRLRLTLRNFAVADPTGPVPLLAFDELVADVATASLWHRAPVLDAVKLMRPRVHVVRDADGRYSVQDVLDRAFAGGEAPPPGFSLNNIEIHDGAIAFDDRKAGRRHEVANLDVAIPFLSSLPYQTEIIVTPRMAGTVNGAHFALAGSTTPFAEHREATVDVDLDALPLPAYVAYLPAPPAYDLAGGALTTRLTIAFVDGPAAERRLEVRGTARLDDLAVRRRDGSPLLAARHVAVALDRVTLFGRDARIASVVVDAPSVDLRRRADGSLELAAPLLASSGDPRPAPSAGPGSAWTVSLAELALRGGTLALSDETSGFRSTLVDVALDAANLTTKRGDRAHVKLAFVSSDRIASFAAEADVEPLVPSATGRFELAKFSLGLLFPYYREALAVDVQKGSIDLASRFTLHDDGNVTLTGGKAAIADLRMALPGQRNPLWQVPAMDIDGIGVDVNARQVTLDEARGRGVLLRLVRERDGTLELERVFKPAGTARDEGTRRDWAFVAKRLVLERASIDAEDRVPDPDVRLAIRSLDATATDLSNVAGTKSRWNVRARVGERGRLAFSGPVGTRPASVSGTLDASDLPLVAAKPYIEPHVNVVFTDGRLAAKGRLAIDVPGSGPVRASWKGDVAIAGFAALDKPTSSDLARWSSLEIEALDVASDPFRASTGRIRVDDFFARVIVYPDATLNFARLLTPGAQPAPLPGTMPAATAPVAGSEGLPIAIGRIELSRGRVDFTDLFIKPNYAVDLTDVAGTVSALSRDQPGDVALTARVEGTAPVEVQGRIHPFAPQLALDLAGKARDIDLPPLTPYSVKYAGYGIEKGKLTFDVRYRVDDRKLSAQNRLVLDQLTFGDRVESPTATKLPVLLAVALLKDARGVIDISLPISGSLDDPQFSVGGLI
ncbi:MAG TPA: DUF748 domain-containing protein, partial [Casimicrobiaceae bacterium]|nr:DUF748 domain-containing protein [Casimicrobiaceae bacterium]